MIPSASTQPSGLVAQCCNLASGCNIVFWNGAGSTGVVNSVVLEIVFFIIFVFGGHGCSQPLSLHLPTACNVNFCAHPETQYL